MERTASSIAVAGHICLDVIPTFDRTTERLDELIQPGRLVEVGAVELSTGGAVSNTGIALHHLGYSPRLIGKVGDDIFGGAVLDLLEEHDASLAEQIRVDAGVDTSYTIVVSPPDVDRFFFHSPGANHEFYAEDVDGSALEAGDLLHFGYPPAMRSMYRSNGEELKRLFEGLKKRGLTTSLDMTYPDPDSEVGQIDWERLLRNVLPEVDLFLPSLEETMFMLDRERLQSLEKSDAPVERQVSGSYLSELAEQLIDMGVAVVGLKLGSEGLYLRTTANSGRFRNCSDDDLPSEEKWLDRELLSPCFRVEVTGTTGSGDCAIAGFLSGWLDRCSPEESMTRAVAAGACNLERMDATSGVPHIQEIKRRIEEGWDRKSVRLRMPEDWSLGDDGILCSRKNS